eukprot:COSAG02_NODE_2293_length_9198_cov_195.076492_7_plen_70_part_00
MINEAHSADRPEPQFFFAYQYEYCTGSGEPACGLNTDPSSDGSVTMMRGAAQHGGAEAGRWNAATAASL